MNIFLSLFAKVPQAVQNLTTRKVGEQSASTVAIQLLGSLIRIYTIMVKLRSDGLMIAGQAFNFVMNGILMLQVLVYDKR